MSSPTYCPSRKCFLRRMLAIFYLIATVLAYGSSDAELPVDGSDLDVFVSRPDLRPPKLHTKVYNARLTSRGYWFISPYGDLRERPATSLYQPLQTGPHIYDSVGNLIWSGAHLADAHRPMQDFKVSIIDSQPHLSVIMMKDFEAEYHPGGVALILNSSYEVVHEINPLRGSGYPDMHEFNIIENGKRALMIVHQETHRQIFHPGASSSLRSILNSGFVEIDLTTGKVVFEWWALDHIDPAESWQHVPTNVAVVWDWLHPNSVDKNEDGDYLLSARYTDTIYKIAGHDGSILWRLGGVNTTFVLEGGFDFSGQHDARFYDPVSKRSARNEEYVSFLNNAAADGRQTSSNSRGMIVALDLENKSARVDKAFPRPDGGLSRLRGNFQILPNSNVLTSWSENAYISEYTASGELLSEMSFTSERFVTYRAYKFDFIGRPTTKPDLKAITQIFGGVVTTAMYVSWNGATEVVAWRFFASQNGSFAEFSTVATVSRQGFETSHIIMGSSDGGCYAEGLDANGEVLGTSQIEMPAVTVWQDAEQATSVEQRFVHTQSRETISPQSSYSGLRATIPWLGARKMFSTFDLVMIGAAATYGMIKAVRKYGFPDRSQCGRRSYSTVKQP